MPCRCGPGSRAAKSNTVLAMARLFPVLVLLFVTSWALAMTAGELRCEFRENPLGVDSLRPRLSWVLSSEKHDQRQSAYRILVASSRALLAKNRGDLWDSGKVASAEQNNIAYAGKALASGQACFWKVRVWDGEGVASAWSNPAHWEMGLLALGDWKGRWINDGRPTPTKLEDHYKEDPAPLFRKEFRVRGAVKRARLYVTGLGYYEASLNGSRVGDHVLDPGWTKFDKRVFYSTYDVTAQVKRGANCIGVALGNGWYNPLPMKMWGNLNLREHLAIGRPRFLAQLAIEYADGTRDTIASDLSWRVGESEIRRNNIYLGEEVDARLAQKGWDRAGFDDAKWRKPALAKEKIGKLAAQPLPPIRAHDSWHPVRVSEPKPGVFIYDCGENFAGWLRVKIALPRGTKLSLRYGELLHKDGTLNPLTSVAGQIKGPGTGGPGAPDVAWQADTYIARGGGETYTQRFAFHAFRYVEVTGIEQPLPRESLTAIRLHADVEPVGEFSCSDDLLNDIQAMCRRTFLSNLFSVQSDCPHRERMGYGGDIAATSEALMANFDMATFYAKAVSDWTENARPDGMFTDTAPFMGIQYCGVAWAMAHPLLIDQLARYYGDTRVNQEHYAAAKRWLALVEKQYPSGIVTDGLSDHEGLAETPAPEMVTPIYYQSARLLASMARALGKAGDAKGYDTLAQKIEAAYIEKFIDGKGKIGTGSQANQAIGLHTGIVPAELREEALANLMQDVQTRGGHLTTGILGTKFMLDELSRVGRADLAYAIVSKRGFPGWAWMLENGATTLWEHWELSENTFSHNHPMFGSVSEWMMKWLGGIQPAHDAIGFDRIVIRPQLAPGISWVKSSYKSVRGKIVSNWVSVGGSTVFEIEVPVNTTAMFHLPGKPPIRLGSGTHVLSDVNLGRR